MRLTIPLLIFFAPFIASAQDVASETLCPDILFVGDGCASCPGTYSLDCRNAASPLDPGIPQTDPLSACCLGDLPWVADCFDCPPSCADGDPASILAMPEFANRAPCVPYEPEEVSAVEEERREQ